MPMSYPRGGRFEWRGPEMEPRTRRDDWSDATGRTRSPEVLQAEADQFSRDLSGVYSKAGLVASFLNPAAGMTLATIGQSGNPDRQPISPADMGLMAATMTVGGGGNRPAITRTVGFPRPRHMEIPQISTTEVVPRSRAVPRSTPEVIDLNPNLSMGVRDSAGRFHSYAEVRADAARFAEEAAVRQANREFLAAAQERAARLQIQGDRRAMAQARGGTHDPKFARTHSNSTLVVPSNGGPAVEFAPAPVQGRVSHWMDLFRKGRQTKEVVKAEASVKTAQSQLSKFDEGIAKLAADGKIDATSPAVAAKRQAFEARVSSAQSKQLAAEGKLQATEQRLSDYARGSAAHADAVGQAARAARSPWEYGFGKWDPQLMPGSWKVKAIVGTGLFTAGAGMYGAYRQAQTRAETAEAVLQDRQVAGDLFNQIESKYLGDPVNTRAILASDDSFRQFYEMVATAAAATYKANHENDPVVRKSLRESIDRRRAAIDERLRNSAPALYRDRLEYLRDSQTTLPGPEAWYDQTDAQADAARGGR